MNNPNPSDPEKQAADEAAKQKQAAEAAAQKEAEKAAAAQKEADKAAAKQAKAESPAWQLPDYAGPLDIRQAQWRLRNIKPVGEVKRK